MIIGSIVCSRSGLPVFPLDVFESTLLFDPFPISPSRFLEFKMCVSSLGVLVVAFEFLAKRL